MIEIHYIKHYPHWDFRSYDTHYDPYSHWNEYTPIYYGTSTFPMEEEPWNKGSKLVNSFVPYIIITFILLFGWARKARRRDLMLYTPWPAHRRGRWKYR